MIAAIALVPALAGLVAFFLRGSRPRRVLLVATALAHLLLTGAAFISPPAPLLDGWLRLDPTGRLFLAVTSVLFLAASTQAVDYLAGEQQERDALATAGGFVFQRVPEAVFTGCMLLLLASLSLVTMCQHFGLLWVAVEATTLASAPLVYFHRDARSLEATWKYLVVCSVGIALALLGNFFLAVAAADTAHSAVRLVVDDLMSFGPGLHKAWLQGAMIFFVVGYGTKMGLAPLHTWLPDAHSEAPAVVSALLSGAVLNGAFLAVLRSLQVCDAAGLGAFARELLLVLGFVSMATAAVFVIRQSDYKRMLAYSSVEHMGVIAVGVGLGGAGAFGALLHAVNHSLAKGMLFLAAGQILALFATKKTSQVRGLLRGYPIVGALWLVGFLAVSGIPPFGAFLSEFTIAKAAADQHRPVVLAMFLGLLGIVFIGMASSVLPMAQGAFASAPRPRPTHRWRAVLATAALGLLALVMGVYIPRPVSDTLQSAASSFGGYR